MTTALAVVGLLALAVMVGYFAAAGWYRLTGGGRR